MKYTRYLLGFVFTVLFFMVSPAQPGTIDLQQALKENKLISNRTAAVPITDGTRKGVSGTGLIWIKDRNFSEGTIEVDLKGKDVFQKSFLGIAFHGVDTITYDLVYFRPFNFRSDDPVRKIHAVQYVSMPDHPWNKLREEQNGQYEKAIDPAPPATEWFHARIVVKDSEITVYVNNQSVPSLTVKKLNNRTSGMIGLWNEGINGEFANLVVK